MLFLNLALKSLKNRAFASTLTVISIALSILLLLSVERVKRAAEEGFTQTISQTDLIVGARSGPVQLILYTVFNIGNATRNISYETYQKLKSHPAVLWTIPYSLGDGHRGFRVVGTTGEFFEHYRFRGDRAVEFSDGKAFAGISDVVIGNDVARKLNYKIGDEIVVAHGVTHQQGVQHHDDKPFKIVGIMKATGTALDQSLYMDLRGIEALHVDWKDGAAPAAKAAEPSAQDKHAAADDHKGHDDHDAHEAEEGHDKHEGHHSEHGHEAHAEDVKIHNITAFFLRTKNRVETLRLQREINTFKDEPLLAIIPGATLSKLWQGLSQVERVLKAISWMVVAVGFMAMLIALTTSLNERRREMAILRAVGASTQKVMALLVFESTVLTLSGIVVGTLLALGAAAVLRPWLETQYGLYLHGASLGSTEWLYLLATLIGGILVGIIPAYRAQKMALKDGLSVQL